MGRSQKVTRDRLNQNGIWFESDVRFDYEQSPPYLQNFRDIILDFYGVIEVRINKHDKCVEYRSDPRDPFKPHYPTERGNDSLVSQTIKRAQNIQWKATDLDHRSDEKEWDDLFYSYMLKPLGDYWQPQATDTRFIERQKALYERFECHGDKLWTLFKTNFRADERLELTVPKPDRMLSFPIYNTKNANRLSRDEDHWRWKGTPVVTENFSLEVLEQLWNNGKGLCSSPFDIYSKAKAGNHRSKDTYRPKDHQCFPWLVVEHKKATNAEFCYCQAANASSAALMLLESAAQYAETRYDGLLVPPIPVITTVGKRVRVWIAWHSFIDSGPDDEPDDASASASDEKSDSEYDQYTDSEYEADYQPDDDISSEGNDDDGGNRQSNYMMEYIWEGELTNIVDIIELEAILGNIHTWAMRDLKPLLSSYIGNWRSQLGV
ncbi:hypothetical protein B0I35DRAFT_445485 [Stachybotrys elegans]|uniref:Uncharacterized protein n=1 Tax=Stachybotrys elegans TaxID=80388 RepID=A0A8K0WJR0_9HYPO|nr:hypothetical protein B0I35DRAFT_445485 [Stachybotrys elegans]